MTKLNTKSIIKFITINALSIALVFIATTVLHVQIGTAMTNLGDAFIFTLGYLFGPITGLLCGSLGSMFADLAVYPTTFLFTFVIKGLEGLAFGLLAKVIKQRSFHPLVANVYMALSALAATLIMIGGYFLAEAFVLYNSIPDAVVNIYYNIVQAVGSVILFIVFYNIFNHIKFFDQYTKGLLVLTDFKDNFTLKKEIVTTYKKKVLILKNAYKYEGPVTMQYIPEGGIQCVFDYHLIINTSIGFIACDNVIYNHKKMTTKQFIEENDELVNTILPN